MRVPLLIDVWVALAIVAGCGLVAGAMVTGEIQPAVASSLFLVCLTVGMFTASRFVSRLRLQVRKRLDALAELAHVEPAGTIWRLDDALETAEALTEQISLRLGAATSRLDTEQARSRSGAALLETAFRSMQDGLVVVASDGRVVLTNPAAQPMLSVSDDASGRPIEEVVRSAEAQNLVKRAMRGDSCSGEFTLSRQGRIVKATAVPLPAVLTPSEADAAAVRTGGVVLVLQDVTDVRKVEQARREFTSNVSHELKTPVTTVRAYVDTLQEAAEDGTLESDTTVRFLNRIDEQAERLHELIGNLMTLAQIDAGAASDSAAAIDIQPVELASAVQQVVGDLQILAERKALTLTVDLAVDSLVLAEREGLRSIVQNLIRNAIQHTPPGGRIAVTASETPGTVQLRVEDTGVGIPREAQSKLFDRFFRVDSARTRDKGGSGLGLAIVGGLVDRFGGRIEVESELDRGTTFLVTLRRADAA